MFTTAIGGKTAACLIERVACDVERDSIERKSAGRFAEDLQTETQTISRYRMSDGRATDIGADVAVFYTHGVKTPVGIAASHR
jgi:hypothetical protein